MNTDNAFDTTPVVASITPATVALVESIHRGKAYVARKYLINFGDELSTAELIGCYRKIIDSGCATDEEECAFLDLVNPYVV